LYVGRQRRREAAHVDRVGVPPLGLDEVDDVRSDPEPCRGFGRPALDGPVDSAQVYFRTAPTFEALAGPYAWLNRSLFVATAARLPAKVQITVFEVV